LSRATIVVATILLSCAARAENPPAVVWTRTVSSSAYELIQGMDVDDQGNVAVVGYTDGNLLRSRIGIRDAFAISYDVTGQQRWGVQFGSANKLTYLEDISASADGNWFAVGRVDYRRGTTYYGGMDTYLQKIGPDGTVSTASQIGTTTTDEGRGVTSSGTSVYVTGQTYGALSGTNAGGSDAFAARYNVSGSAQTQQWIAQKGTSDWDTVYDVAFGGNRLFVAGETFGNFNGPDINYTDAFLMAYDANGSFQWVRQYGKSTEPETAYAVATNGVDAVYIAGTTYLGQSWSSGGAPDAFLAKYDLNGNFQWQRYYQTSVWDVHMALDLDAAGNIYVGGYTGQQSVTPTEASVLLMKYSSSGDLIWKNEYDIAEDQRPSGMAVSPMGDKIWIAGSYWIDDNDPVGDGFVTLLSQGLDGDINGDGRVDAADYVSWRKNSGTSIGYNTWRQNFGKVAAGAGAALGDNSASVPEPSCIALLILGHFARRFKRPGCRSGGSGVGREVALSLLRRPYRRNSW
jgi:hypothetical protein